MFTFILDRDCFISFLLWRDILLSQERDWKGNQRIPSDIRAHSRLDRKKDFE